MLVIIGRGAAGGKMPGFRKKLGDETVEQLAAYVHDLSSQPEPPTVTAVSPKAKPTAADVKTIYSAKCAHCHGEDGRGGTVIGREMKIPDFQPKIADLSDVQLFNVIAHGADGGRMPGFQKKLGPDMVAELARYVRTSWENPSVTSNGPTLPPVALLNQQVTEPSGKGQQVSVAVESKSDNLRSSENMVKSERLTKSDTAAVRSSPQKVESPEVIDLNSASKEMLMTLLGLTEQDVDNIIKSRPFKSTSQFRLWKSCSPSQKTRRQYQSNLADSSSLVFLKLSH